MGNTLELQAWADPSYGGSQITKIAILSSHVVQIHFGNTERDGKIDLYLANEENIIALKNKVLWAYEEYLRNKRG